MAKLVAENRNRLMVPQIEISVIDDAGVVGYETNDDNYPAINNFNDNDRHWDNNDDDGEYGYELDINEYFDDEHRFDMEILFRKIVIV